MVKPVRPAELAARIDCLLLRAYPAQLAQLAPLRLGEYAFDCALRKVTCNGDPVGLTPKEFDLAVLLFRNEGRIVIATTSPPRSGAARSRRCRAPSIPMSRACAESLACRQGMACG